MKFRKPSYWGVDVGSCIWSECVQHPRLRARAIGRLGVLRGGYSRIKRLNWWKLVELWPDKTQASHFNNGLEARRWNCCKLNIQSLWIEWCCIAVEIRVGHFEKELLTLNGIFFFFGRYCDYHLRWAWKGSVEIWKISHPLTKSKRWFEMMLRNWNKGSRRWGAGWVKSDTSAAQRVQWSRKMVKWGHWSEANLIFYSVI